jgi:hypothetical protein
MVNTERGSLAQHGTTKKGAAVAGGSKVNREASNRVDRSHSMSRTLDDTSNGRESLITP